MMTMNSLSVQSAVFWCPSHSFFFLSIFYLGRMAASEYPGCGEGMDHVDMGQRGKF